MERRGEESIQWWARTTLSFAGWKLSSLGGLALVGGMALVLGDRVVLGLLLVLLGVATGALGWAWIRRD
jgi:hypothetical protein